MASNVAIIESKSENMSYWVILIFLIQVFNIVLLLFALIRPWLVATLFLLSIGAVTLSVDVWGHGLLIVYIPFFSRTVFNFSVGYMVIYGIIALVALCIYALVSIFALYTKLSYGRIRFHVFKYVLLSNLLGVIIFASAILFIVVNGELPVIGLPGVNKLSDLRNFTINGKTISIPLSLGEGFWLFFVAGILMLTNFVLAHAFKNRFYEDLLKYGV